MLNKEILELCKKNANKKIRSLPKELEDFSKFLNLSPNTYQLFLSTPKFFEEIIKKDFSMGNWLYWKEMDERIRFLCISLSYKSEAIFREIINSINSFNFLPAIILIRSFLEHAAVIHYYLWKIIPLYNKINSDKNIQKIIKGELKGIFVSEELEDLLILYSHGTRKSDLVSINEKWMQKNVLTMIDFLSKIKIEGLEKGQDLEYIPFRLVPNFRKRYPKGEFWNDGYFCASCGSDFEKALKYIENQELHHSC